MAAIGNKAKLGIPAVNQRPRIGGGLTPLKGALAQRIGGSSYPGPSSSATTSAPTAPSDPFKTAAAAKGFGGLDRSATVKQRASTMPAAPPPPAANSATPTFTEPTLAPGQPDPRDATYYANLAKLRFNDEQEYAKDLREQTTADTNYNYALKQAIQARGRQERNLGLETIKSGLVDSGFHDRTDREQAQSYTEERAHASITKEQEDQARAAARKALQEGYTVEAAALLAEAAARYAQIQREEAANAAGEPNPQAAAAAPGTGAGQRGYTGTGKAAGPFWGPKGPGGYPPPGGKGGGGGGGRGNGGTTAPKSDGPNKKQRKKG